MERPSKHVYPDLLVPADIGIVGNGYVGGAMAYGFTEVSKGRDRIRVYDANPRRSLHPFRETIEASDFIFVCLPTPMYSDGSGIDLTYIRKSLAEITPLTDDTDKLVILKSTIIPESTRRFQEMYPSTRLAYNPEFLTEANWQNDIKNAPITVLGAFRDEDLTTLDTLYRPRFPQTHIHPTDPTTAEHIKYAANIHLAVKITINNIFYDYTQSTATSWEEVSSVLAREPRFGPTHWMVTSARGFGGKCLPKDIEAGVADMESRGIDCSVLRSVIEYNKRIRKDHDWHNIPGAVSAPPTDRDELYDAPSRILHEAVVDSLSIHS
ncbi:hypothetical protein A3C32_03735 [Candidatus Daviesbacteria bacterium RIFCSPHIGHO2_02_FULL_41_14]|nr:MAG: hypothetical protein A3C32_03735 [Candidatus Daviesbacteria bacterium RIFCSPHIGHO2_02_FULL_41_14]